MRIKQYYINLNEEKLTLIHDNGINCRFSQQLLLAVLMSSEWRRGIATNV